LSPPNNLAFAITTSAIFFLLYILKIIDFKQIMGFNGSFNSNYLRMKKLGKLSINPSKVMRNEELVNLNGGYGGGFCTCIY
jgi:hypothetical protein